MYPNEPIILQEEKEFIVCVKPFGYLSEESEKGKSLPLYLLKNSKKTGENTRFYPVHRLDKETGGVMVYAKTTKMASILSEKIRCGEFEKLYLAEVTGEINPLDGEMKDLLFHDRKKNKSFVVQRKRQGVKVADLFYKTVEQRENSAIVQIKLLTGRTHQIRVQFSSRGNPVLGDRKYGGEKSEFLHLWAYRLAFSDEFGKQLVFQMLPPFFQTDLLPI